MLVHYKTPQEMLSLLDYFKNHMPHMMAFYYGAKLQIEQRFPESPIELWTDEWPNARYWIMLQKHEYVRYWIYITAVRSGTPTELRNFIVEFLNQSAIKQLNHIQMCSLGATYCTEFAKTIAQLSPDFTIYESVPCVYFYMNSEQEQLVMSTDADGEINLPDGYEFCELDAKRDGQIVTSSWQYAKDGDLEMTQKKLINMPSVGVVASNDENRQPIAFEMVDSVGRLQHQYTVDAHRQQGIGKCIELALCRKLIQVNICPSKHVVIENRFVLESSKKSKFWSIIIDEVSESNEPLIAVYQEFYRPSPK